MSINTLGILWHAVLWESLEEWYISGGKKSEDAAVLFKYEFPSLYDLFYFVLHGNECKNKSMAQKPCVWKNKMLHTCSKILP